MNPKQLFRAFFSKTPGRWQRALTASVFAVLLAIFGGTVWAFPTYEDCAECHGKFFDLGNPYISLHDGANWGTYLMGGHLPLVGGNCSACHSEEQENGEEISTYLNLSADVTLSKSCVGCHGRDEDVTGNCTGLLGNQVGVEAECGSGAGLRLVHESQVGAGTCNGCHIGDATPVGEHIAPYYYGLSGVILKDSCDGDGTESQFGATGLDNDGDGQRDGNDSDCEEQENSPPTQPGTLSASTVTTNSATIQWSASSDDDGDPISYQVDYRRNGEMPWSDGGNTNNTSQPLGGLDAGQSYDVRVTPNDGNGDGPVRSTFNLFQTESVAPLFAINAGHSGAWYTPDTSGQGQLIDVVPATQFMFLAWFTFTAAASNNPDEQHWYTAQGNYSGNTAPLILHETLGGTFDDPQQTSTNPVGTVSVSFSDCEQGQMTYSIDTDGREGTISMQRVIPGSGNVCEEQSSKAAIKTEAVDINAGMDGAWVDNDTLGQGFLIDAHTNPDGSNFIFVAWFTYGDDTASGQRWLTAQGDFAGSTDEIDIYETTGGSFNDPQAIDLGKVGTMTIDFEDCNNAQLTYSLTDEGVDGDMAISRLLIPVGQALCEELNGAE
jgi:hypothetical protein